MAHRCVKCGRIYGSAAPEILKGCECGSHYFFFFKDEDIALKEETDKLTREEREEIVEDINELVGVDIEKPIILDLESIRVQKPGKFEIDLVGLFKRKPVIYKIGEGKYYIDIASTFQLQAGKKWFEKIGVQKPERTEDIDEEIGNTENE
ncbi:MAG: Zn-ribbon domain-containing protein [Candidatus Pacearchaeota archaeon]|nr:Zn-ribbon domain-containing protein [Candidatus Pacearchaeota archaeon]